MDSSEKLSTTAKVGCVVIALVFLCGFCSMLFGVKKVSPTEQAVSTRFGAIKGIRGSGVHFDPFSSYTKYDSKIQTHSSRQSAATRDLQDIEVEVTVTYRIDTNHLVDIYKNVGNEEMIKAKILDPNIAQNLKSTSTRYSAEELIQKRTQLREEVLKSIRDNIQSQYHIEVVDVSLTNFAFTNPDFNAAIDRKQIAEQDALKAKFDLEQTKIQAEQQRVQKTTLTNEILMKMWIEKWDGHLPSTLAGEESVIMLPSK